MRGGPKSLLYTQTWRAGMHRQREQEMREPDGENELSKGELSGGEKGHEELHRHDKTLGVHYKDQQEAIGRF